jgi:uncharacterized protein (TIGR03663 family)
MRRAAHLVGAAAVLAAAAWLRFEGLGRAPVQADEATGARLAANILAGDAPRFDPSHFHGPVLWLAGATAARAAGEHEWDALTSSTLRTVPALAGCLVVLAALASFPLVGRRAALLGGAFLAASPVAVHFSRVFLHEPLLAAALAGALLSAAFWWRRPAWPSAIACGACLGLAAATKESFLLAPASWVAAAVVLGLRPPTGRAQLARAAAACLAAGFAVVALFHTNFLTAPSGLLDFAATYWSYELGQGHGKPFGFYANLLFAPAFHGRLVWWFGAPAVLAMSVFFAPTRGPAAVAARFFVVAAATHLALISLLPYKTPWLALVPALELAAAAGFAGAAWMAAPRARTVLAAGLAVLLALDAGQSIRGTRTYFSDPRNPLCYVPTVPGIATWTHRVGAWLALMGTPGPVAVVGSGYWPLPWYLRGTGEVGYWKRVEDAPADTPVVIALPDAAADAGRRFGQTHLATYEGVRDDTPAVVFIRRDIWQRAVGDQP